VSRAGEENDTEVLFLDDAVEMDVGEVQSGHGAPMAEQARFDMLARKRLLQERIIEEVNLADGEIVGRTPVGVDLVEQVWCESSSRSRRWDCLHMARVPTGVRASRLSFLHCGELMIERPYGI
jgi:hypothetical protein